MNSVRERGLDLNINIESLIRNSLDIVDSKYSIDGWTFPANTSDEVVQTPLFYHNGDHTRMVVQDTKLLSEGLGLNSSETNIALLAASNHDIEQDFDSGQNELKSKDKLEKVLKENGFSRIAIQTGCLAILGTIPRFENSTIVQKAIEQSYPTKRAELISHIVAGADVGRLFGKVGPLLSHKLFLELQLKNKKHITMQDLVVYQNSQIDFLEKYSYPSKEIENILSIKRSEVIKHIIQLIKEMEAGNITRFNEVIAKDIEFIRIQS